MTTRWITGLIVLAGAAPAGADVINVPADHPTIQAAIDAAVNGDEVVVSAGTYNESISTLGKAITVRSASGVGVTTIDGTGTFQPVVRCNVGEGPETVIEGFTITGGDPNPAVWQGGGGVFINGASPSMVNCRMTANTAPVGGGLYCSGGSPVLTGCRFDDNEADRGGAVAFFGSAAPTLTSCLLLSNRTPSGEDCFTTGPDPGCRSHDCELLVCAIDAFCCITVWDAACVTLAEEQCYGIESRGGALYGEDCSIRLRDCRIDDNAANFFNPTVSKGSGQGGGAYCNGGDLTMVRCELTDNDSSTGGGIQAGNMSLTVIACEVSGNTALGSGGIATVDSDVLMSDSLVTDNFAGFGGGGGLVLFGGDARVVNCTFTSNLGIFGAAGIEASHSADVKVDNSIVYGNLSNDPLPGSQISGTSVAVRYSCVEGGFPGPGNIDADPLFINAGAGDYHVVIGSPCADAGHNNALPQDRDDLDDDGNTGERLPHDLDGNPRIVADRLDFDPGCGLGAVVDIGAYETPGTPLDDVPYSDVNGDGFVDVDDVVRMILDFGPCPPGCCFSDVDFDGAVTIDDVIAAILNWG